MQTTGEIRFDLIYKDLSSPLNGRYSYSNLSKSWIKTKKTQLIKEQIDVMLSEKTFRFAVNNEDETEVCFQDLEALKEELIKRKFKQVDIRLKRTLKCTKGNII
jgi:predicted flavoprotein YhiN